MATETRLLLLAALMACAGACGHLPLMRGRSGPPEGPPVAVILEGSAFGRITRARTLNALEAALGRPVRPLAASPGPGDAEVRALAARLLGARPGIARYDWREPRCTAERPVLAAAAHGTDAVYRASLEYATRTRPATDAEWDAARSFRRLFRRPSTRPAMREELLSGTVVRTGFAARDATTRAALYRRRVTRADDPRRIDVAAAVAETVTGMGPLPAPDWDGLARRLVEERCPFLGLAVSEARVRDAGRREAATDAAVAAMRAALAPRPAPAPAAEPAPPAADESTAGPAQADAAPSCQTLCAMHMVEICNADKLLWSAHRAPWEPTPCGTRRDEPFLAQCYERQWQTGTFDTSCVQPCESSPEGRERLMAILRDAGCVPTPGPS